MRIFHKSPIGQRDLLTLYLKSVLLIVDVKSVPLVLFGRNSNKIAFDARRLPEQILSSPEAYSYVHRFRVHFKASKIHTKSKKVDIAVSSSSPHIPTHQEVELEFNQWMLNMMMDANKLSIWTHHEALPSFHITKVEYRESLGKKYDVSNLHNPELAAQTAF